MERATLFRLLPELLNSIQQIFPGYRAGTMITCLFIALTLLQSLITFVHDSSEMSLFSPFNVYFTWRHAWIFRAQMKFPGQLSMRKLKRPRNYTGPVTVLHSLSWSLREVVPYERKSVLPILGSEIRLIRALAAAYTTTMATLDPSRICDNFRSFTCWARSRIEPVHSQRQYQVLNLLSHNGNSWTYFNFK